MRATDMRKGFDGLSGLIKGELEKDPMDGSVYIFINKRRDRMKLLV
jgi:transposase